MMKTKDSQFGFCSRALSLIPYIIPIIQNCLYHTPGHSKATQSVVGEMIGPEVPPQSSTSWSNQWKFPVSLPPTNLGGSSIIELDYIIEVSKFYFNLTNIRDM